SEDTAVIVAGDRVDVLFSDGEAGFKSVGGLPYVSYAVGASPSDLAIGDVDGDGDLDIAVANAGDDTVTLLINDGSGNFTPVTKALPAGSAPSRIAVGDLNADGTADLVLATAAPEGILVVLSAR
ncbi:MAG TPA: VCBS repeat-containing protein, partial [Minicystis sp.]|nr:VCBS repeat-containing protein [Minicystis sp.]